jgi:hypothetical protein
MSKCRAKNKLTNIIQKTTKSNGIYLKNIILALIYDTFHVRICEIKQNLNLLLHPGSFPIGQR